MYFYEKIKIRKLFAVVIGLLIALSVIGFIFEVSTNNEVDGNLMQLILYSILALWFCKKFVKDKEALNKLTSKLPEQFKWKEAAYLIILHLLITIGFIFTLVLIVSLFNPMSLYDVLNSNDGVVINGLGSKIFYSLTAVFLAPIVEETIFRGIILNRLKVRFGAAPAIIISSILFGILHAKFAMVGAIVFGICMALIYLRTNNILVSMVIHFINNLLVCLISFLPGGSTDSSIGFDISDIKILGLIGVVSLIISIVMFIKYIKANWTKDIISKNKVINKKDLKGTAVLIINMQQGVFGTTDRNIYEEQKLLDNVQKVIEKARFDQLPIIYLQHGYSRAGVFQIDTDGWRIHQAIKPINGDVVVHKNTPDSFLGTALEKELDAKKVGNLIIAGLQTEYCVDTTCRRAASMGYNVTLIEDAHSTYNTELIDAETIIKHHNRILSNSFVNLRTTEEMVGNNFFGA